MPVTLSTQPTAPEPLVPPRKRWTREECSAMEKAGLIDLARYELIEGELIQRMGKNHPHNRALCSLPNWLRRVFGMDFVMQEPSIDVAPEDNPTSEPEPDVVVLNRPYHELTA